MPSRLLDVEAETSRCSVPPIPVPTTTSTTNTCAPSYTGGQTTVTGTGTLPKPTSFVAKNGLQLQLDGRPYRIVGPNAYWLGTFVVIAACWVALMAHWSRPAGLDEVNSLESAIDGPY